MAISRAQLMKELVPGLNALFGIEYKRYEEEHKEIFSVETSERSFEEETKISGFGPAPVKNEGSATTYDEAQESYTARYTHETVSLGFAITEEAFEDNLYDSLSRRYTKALARSMAHTKQVKGAATLNNSFNAGFPGGDGDLALQHAASAYHGRRFQRQHACDSIGSQRDVARSRGDYDLAVARRPRFVNRGQAKEVNHSGLADFHGDADPAQPVPARDE